MTRKETNIPLLPLDLPGRRDSATSPAGAAFLNARWMTTAALLRAALSEERGDDTGPAEKTSSDEMLAAQQEDHVRFCERFRVSPSLPGDNGN